MYFRYHKPNKRPILDTWCKIAWIITYCLLHTRPHSATIFHSFPCSKWNSYPLMQDCWPMLWFCPSTYIWHWEYWVGRISFVTSCLLSVIDTMLSGKLWFVPLPISIILSDLVKDVTSSKGSHNDLVELSGGYMNIKMIFIHSNSK